jgi:hypothetical protein
MDCWSGEQRVKAGECPRCGADVDKDGQSLEVCWCSPVLCDECGDAPCDGSC